MAKEKIVIGKNSGAIYEIEKQIGSGGQGRVFSIKGGKYAFKLRGRKTGSKAHLLTRTISYIKTRPITDLPISIPLEQVDGEALGYIMEMATDMIPIEDLIKPEDGKSISLWWKETGGLNKRILILKKIAATLSKLHSRGLVYGDFSLSNIFVSSDKEYSEIFFIDSDNITHESKVGTAVYTPGYAAPEIIETSDHKATSGYDTYTDNFSFAVIAYQLLTLNHPFIGDYVNDGEPELEEQAYLGKIPWVSHSADYSNVANSGVPTSLTISKKMMAAFCETFEDGIIERLKRTSSGKWNEILGAAVDAILQCHNKTCNQDFFYSEKFICPFCETKINFIGMVGIYPAMSGIKKEIIESHGDISLKKVDKLGQRICLKLISPDTWFVISEDDVLINSSNLAALKIKFSNDSLFIEGISQKRIDIIRDEELTKSFDISSVQRIVFKKNIRLSLVSSSNYKRVLKVSIKIA